MPSPSTRRLLPIVLVYLPLPIIGAILSIIWNVGADPGSTAADLPLRGTPLAPPLFLPVVLLVAAAAARRPGVAGRVGAGVSALVGAAFLGGSTFNLPNDFATAADAGTPLALTAVLAVLHIALAISLLYNGLPGAFRRTAGAGPAVAAS